MMSRGVQGFIDDLARLGLCPAEEGGLVIYRIIPIDGAHAGTEVETGVSVEELAPWPQAPPHWIHLPTSMSFPKTNSKASTRPGWIKHSRDVIGWGDSPPGTWWSGHVRAALGEAIS